MCLSRKRVFLFFQFSNSPVFVGNHVVFSGKGACSKCETTGCGLRFGWLVPNFETLIEFYIVAPEFGFTPRRPKL